ncbi:MAG: hypothetical protein QOI86_1607, partial [Actinomycetota bacterium]|nr:hypothetical protein [Actinomycetota bacterium]
MGTSKDRAEVQIDDYVCLALYTASRAVTGWYRDQLE